MKPVTIYLANLSHVDDEGHAANESIPLNIGYLASYLKAYLDTDCQISLFNIPQKLEKALSKEVPDILACSNYMWNFQLNYLYLAKFKTDHPYKVTIMGGPNYPGQKEPQEAFLRRHNRIDFYCYMEGELSLLHLVKELFNSQFDIDEVKKAKIKGCHFIHQDRFIDCGAGQRIEDIDSIPSPYLDGRLDQFLSDGFVPVLQTNRGCPFTCAYCLCGQKYYHKVQKFNRDRVLREIEYISERVKSKSLHITDSNFGLFSGDKVIASALSRARAVKGWPLMVNVATAKINKERVSECLHTLGESIFFSASMQSLNENTLQQIRRKNFPFHVYKDIISELEAKGVRSLCEFIIAMPEETKETHLSAIKEAVDVGVKFIAVHTCILLYNTVLREDPYYDHFNLLKKYRVIPRAFGEYMGTKIVETEQVSVASDTMSIDDYLYLRGFHFILSTFYNFSLMEEIICYLKKIGVSIFDWLIRVQEHIRRDAGPAGKLYSSFVSEAAAELWDSEEALISYYNQSHNFQRLQSGLSGANLILKYQALCLDTLKDFVDLAVKAASSIGKDANPEILDNLKKYIISMRGNIFDISEKSIQEKFSFDVPAWIKSDMSGNALTFSHETTMVFRLTNDKVDILKNYKKLYGDNDTARGKTLARIPIAVLSREYRYQNE